jgi:pimeloyl-ACP methyl ester carboxylesterase
VTLGQAARFQEVCRLYVPLYRQITLGTYAASAWSLDQRLEVAFSDVADAFAHYLGQHNHGRKVVVMGHSQGAYMAVQLLKRFFDRDPALRPRLLAGLPIGGRVEVPPGERTGGTFSSLPVCTGAEEIGCIVAFRTYREGADVTGDAHGPPAGLETACVNPAPPRATLSRSYFPTMILGQGALRAFEGITTPFVMMRDLYSVRCAPGAGGYWHLEISESRAPGDQRPMLFDPMDPRFERTTLGLHVLEMYLAQGDLVDLVARKAAAVQKP